MNTSPPSVVSAAARGLIRACTVSEMIAAARPSLTSVRAYVASSALIARSLAATIPMPPARTAPEIRVTTGLSRVAISRCSATIRFAPSSIPTVVASERSAPEQKTFPSCRTSTTCDRVVGLGPLEPLEQLGDQLLRQRVAVVRGVEGDRGDRVGDGVVDELVWHAGILPSGSPVPICTRSGSWRCGRHGVPTSPTHPVAVGDEPPRVTIKLRFALYGVLAALAGTGVGHLVAALTSRRPRRCSRSGELVIDHTPTPVKEWAIAHFGTHDKTILVGSVLVGVLVLAAVAGLLARRSFRYGAALLIVLVAVALYAALSRPVVHPVDAVPGLVTGVVGLAVLWSLTRLEQGRPLAPGRRRAEPTHGGQPTRPCSSPPAVSPPLAAASGYAGRVIAHARQAIGDIALPKPASPAPCVPARARRQGPRHHAVPHPERRLLPRRHPALAADRRRRLLVADHRRRRRPASRRSASTTCWRCR